MSLSAFLSTSLKKEQNPGESRAAMAIRGLQALCSRRAPLATSDPATVRQPPVFPRLPHLPHASGRLPRRQGPRQERGGRWAQGWAGTLLCRWQQLGMTGCSWWGWRRREGSGGCQWWKVVAGQSFRGHSGKAGKSSE